MPFRKYKETDCYQGGERTWTWKFYQDQKTERKAHMSGHDKIFETRSKQQLERGEILQQKEKRGPQLICPCVIAPPTVKGNADDVDYQQPHPGCSYHQDTVTLTFPKRIMECVDICSTADRLGLSNNQVTAEVSATLKAGGADLDNLSSQPLQQDGAGC